MDDHGTGGRARAYMAEQPAALAATLRSFAAHGLTATRTAEDPAQPRQKYTRVALVGSGSSKNALHAAAGTFAALHGCPVSVEGPLEFMASFAGDRGTADRLALAVVVSQSGTSTTTADALKTAQSRFARTVAVTADPESPFGRLADEPAILPIGHEAIGPKTKGFTSTIAALASLAATTAGSGASALPEPDAYEAWAEAQMPSWVAAGQRLAARYARCDHVMVMGSGRHFGTALEGSLKLQEMAGMPASAFDLEDALHGRFHGLGSRSLALFLVGEQEEERLALGAAAVLQELGVAVEILRTTRADASKAPAMLPAGHGMLDVIDLIVPLQAFAVAAAQELGVDADLMRYPGLSQRLGIKTPAR